MWLFFSSIGVSWGADGVDGLLLAGASPLESTVSVGAYGGAAYLLFGGGYFAGGVDFSVGGGRVAVIGTVFHGYASGSTLGSPTAAESTNVHVVSLRYLAYESDGFRFAPMITNVLTYERPLLGSIGVGAAIEGGGEKVRADLSIPSIVGIRAGFIGEEYGLQASVLQAGAEVGLTVRLGDVHRLRIGIPALTWGVRTEHVTFDLSGSFLILFGGVSAKLGVRF